MTATYHYKQIHDATYAYTVQGDGEPLVLLHGFTGSSKTWDECVKRWREHFTVITIDLPGHGQTVTKSPCTMETFCADLQRFLGELHIQKAHLLGYSMGGRTALSFAMNYPEQVLTLTLESASPGLKTKEERKTRVERDTLLAEQIMRNGVASFTDYWENIPLFQTQKQLPNTIKSKIRMERLSQTEKGLAESLLYMGTGKQPSGWRRLHELKMPVSLIVGEEDKKFVQINEQIEKKLQNGQLYIVDYAGHTVHVEQVTKFVKIVLEFLTKNHT